MTRELCPLCGSEAANTVGPVYSGSTGFLWRRRTFEEQLFRCREGHVFSVRRENGSVSTVPYASVEEWLERTTGAKAPDRPPGL